MVVPRWYRITLVVWLCTGLPLQWFFTAFNGLPFLSLPDAPGADGPPVLVWVVSVIVLYHPALTTPVALWLARTRRQTSRE